MKTMLHKGKISGLQRLLEKWSVKPKIMKMACTNFNSGKNEHLWNTDELQKNCT